MRHSSLVAIILAAIGAWCCAEADTPRPSSPILFQETFDDADLLARGWYDGSRFAISAPQAFRGAGCLEYAWKAGSTNPSPSSGVRRLFSPTPSVYLRLHLKLSPGWKWSGRPYHPHLLHFLTTENDRFRGPAATHLTVYVEPWNGKLRLAAQDIQNRDEPHGLTQGPLRGGYNGRFFDSRDELFVDDRWHTVEAYFQLNTLDAEGKKANADGIVRAWFDGRLVIERTDVVLRSPDFPRMRFNQLLLAPYFGPGLLPGAQTLWVDELAVGTARPDPPGGG